ncbi:MAG: tRNA pseudouridine(38-40) synthase TruA [Bacteroidota bacterium]
MGRYMIHLAYNGANFNGWQRQPHSPSVQQHIEDIFSLVLRTPIEITGCGRTDTGVHADEYFAHFDFAGAFPDGLLRRLNRLLPSGIVILQLYKVPSGTHARFDARLRAYRYEITFVKDPFRPDTVTVFPFADRVDTELLNATAALIRSYSEFTPFCKTNSDAKTMNCMVRRATWDIRPDGWTFHISANRFLRGMVRLIVGCCLEVGQGKLELQSVRHSLDEQVPLQRPLSAPAEGLFLTEVEYPQQGLWELLDEAG